MHDRVGTDSYPMVFNYIILEEGWAKAFKKKLQIVLGQRAKLAKKKLIQVYTVYIVTCSVVRVKK